MKNIQKIKELCESQEYDKIYELFGKSIYLKYTPKDYQIKDIDELLKQGRFNDIYNKYGKLRKIYVKNFEKYIKADIKKLLEEGNFEEIRIKYGDKEYNKHLHFMYKKDISSEIGKKKRKLYNLKKKVGIVVTTSAIVASAIAVEPMVTLAGINMYNQNVSAENLQKYADMVEDYENYIKEYADEVNNLDLTDIQVIMKVMNDIWQRSSYGIPRYDIYGFWEYDIYKKGPALCRNIAADFARKMNAINPNYQATNIAADVTDEYLMNVAVSNIERSYSSASYYNRAPDKSSEYYIDENDRLDPELGNHIVTLVTMSDGCILCIDSTNPSIGIINLDKIAMLSSNVEMDYMNKGTVYIMPFTSSITYNLDKLKRIFDTHSREYYEEKYGVIAQNEALEYIKNLESTSIKK